MKHFTHSLRSLLLVAALTGIAGLTELDAQTAPTITTPQLVNARVGVPLDYTIDATGATQIVVKSGTLPDGLELDAGTGVLSGSPTTAGESVVTVTASNDNGSADGVIAFVVLPANPEFTNLPVTLSLEIGVLFQLDIDATNDPTSICADSLPPGLGINCTTGVITGTPSAAGSYPVEVTATNDGGSTNMTVIFSVVEFLSEESYFAADAGSPVQFVVHAKPDRTGSLFAFLPATDQMVIAWSISFGPDWSFSVDLPPAGGVTEESSLSGFVAADSVLLGYSGEPTSWVAPRVSGGVAPAIMRTELIGESLGEVAVVVLENGRVEAFLDSDIGSDHGAGTTNNPNAVSLTTTGGVDLEIQKAGASVTGTIEVAGVIHPVGGIALPTQPHRDLVNLSGRAFVNGEANPAIVGFVLSGSGLSRLLVRTAGPALSSLGVSGFVADPRLTVHDAQGGLIGANNDWSSSTDVDAIEQLGSEVGAFALARPSQDAAVAIELSPALYTAVGTGNTAGATGVVAVEVYDGTPNPGPGRTYRMTNSSVRSWVAADEQVTIGGFVILGNIPKRMLIRGIGPGLEGLGVSNVLADPVLDLVRNAGGTNQPVTSNDDWSSSASKAGLLSAFSTVGAFSLDDPSTDAAILITLEPGVYTALLSGKNAGAGNALLEVYELGSE